MSKPTAGRLMIARTQDPSDAVPKAPPISQQGLRNEPGPEARSADQLGESILQDARRERLRRAIWVNVIRLLALAIFVGGWQLSVALGLVQKQIVSKPSAIWSALVEYFRSGTIYPDLWATLEATILGLAVGAAVGIALGVILAKLPMFERAFSPYLTLLNALPRPALAPIFLVWFGLGVTSKVTVAASLVVFVLLLNTISGIRAVDPDISNLGSSLAISSWQRFWYIDFPSSLPFIVAGLRLGAVYSVLGVIVTEMVASYRGLGQQLVLATNNIQMDQAFAVILIAGAIAVVLNGSISYCERLLRRRYQ